MFRKVTLEGKRSLVKIKMPSHHDWTWVGRPSTASNWLEKCIVRIGQQEDFVKLRLAIKINLLTSAPAVFFLPLLLGGGGGMCSGRGLT